MSVGVMNITEDFDQLQFENFKTSLHDFKQCMDALFVLLMGSIICFLLSGFAMLEAGSVRAKNVTTNSHQKLC